MTALLPLHTGAGLDGAVVAAVAVVVTVVVAGFVLGCWYLLGLQRLLAHSRHRPQLRRRVAARAAALLAAVATLTVVTAPAVGEALEQRFSTHMVQHLVLIMVVAPLLALAAPGQALLVGMPRALRRPGVRAVRRVPTVGLLTPHAAWGLHIGALWAWHLPATYDAAVASEPVHLLEHASFLLTAWLFWWHLTTLTRHRLRGPAAALYVASAIPPGAALGAVLTFPDHLLYPQQAARAVAAGVDPLLDQRVAGLVMWVPLDFAYLALAIWLFGRWLARLESRGPRPVTLPRLPADALAVPSPHQPREVAS